MRMGREGKSDLPRPLEVHRGEGDTLKQRHSPAQADPDSCSVLGRGRGVSTGSEGH